MLCVVSLASAAPQLSGLPQGSGLPDGLAYATAMERANWQASGDRFACRLSQDLSFFGRAEFVQSAGLGTQFVLHADRNPLHSGPARLSSVAPVWAPQLQGRELGTAFVAKSDHAVVVGDQQANLMLAELQRGLAPVIQGQAEFDSLQNVIVGLSPRHFRQAFDRFQKCQGGLLRHNYSQISRSRIHFDTDQHSLTPSAKARLNDIINYAKADNSVRRFYVDGHTDDQHDRYYNIELSKRRAQAVSRFLSDSGISKDRIVTRYHGERYPVVPNVDESNRAQNRRVTIRLERRQIAGR